ncbi:MAG: prepilin-type N-terminal cleavage/methylation domain-containing protein [bacterium]
MKKRQGLTFIEIVISIFIAAVLLAFLTTTFRTFFAPRLYNAVRRVKSDIEYTQNLAETTQIPHSIVFDPSLNRYTVYQGTTTIIPDPVRKKPMIRDFINSREFQNVDIELAEFPIGTEHLDFNDDGVPLSGGRVHMAFESERYEINIEDNTGNVTIQKLN